ncbi:MAG: YqgE/AlgH family protein [Bacteroidetes bacterium]|nr:MAG: YqgE/AlgH family protein [Bacteroidota bacterium]
MDNMDKYIKVSSNNLLPAKGRLLLSEPLMGDYYFGRAVILLAEHDNEGTFGVVLNKPIEHKFNSIVKDFPDFDAPLFLGGPVEPNNLFFIHTVGDIIEGSMEIGQGVYWGGNIDIVKDMISYGSIKPNDIRFSVGYSGWSPNQLNNELKKNSWVVSPDLNKDILNVDPKDLWEQLLAPLGEKYKYWPNFPSDPGLN